MSSIVEKMDSFIKDVSEASKNNSIPKWFKPFVESIKTLAKDVSKHVTVLESMAEIHKNVTDKLSKDRERMETSIKSLENKIDEQQQYSRRNCLLLHGVKEEKKRGCRKKSHGST